MKAIEKDLSSPRKEVLDRRRKILPGECRCPASIAFAEMSGLMGNKDIAATAKDGNRWKKLDIEEKGFLEPSNDIAILTYEAKAVRGNWRALCGDRQHRLRETRTNGWKMMFHSHTPLEDAKKKVELRKRRRPTSIADASRRRISPRLAMPSPAAFRSAGAARRPRRSASGARS